MRTLKWPIESRSLPKLTLGSQWVDEIQRIRSRSESEQTVEVLKNLITTCVEEAIKRDQTYFTINLERYPGWAKVQVARWAHEQGIDVTKDIDVLPGDYGYEQYTFSVTMPK